MSKHIVENLREHKFRIYAFFTIIFSLVLMWTPRILEGEEKSYSFIRRFCLRTCHFPYDAYMNFLCSFGTCRRKVLRVISAKKKTKTLFLLYLNSAHTFLFSNTHTTFKLHMKLKLLSIMPLSYDFYDFLIMSPLFFHVKSA